jgi:hypothetical protein
VGLVHWSNFQRCRHWLFTAPRTSTPRPSLMGIGHGNGWPARLLSAIGIYSICRPIYSIRNGPASREEKRPGLGLGPGFRCRGLCVSIWVLWCTTGHRPCVRPCSPHAWAAARASLFAEARFDFYFCKGLLRFVFESDVYLADSH